METVRRRIQDHPRRKGSLSYQFLFQETWQVYIQVDLSLTRGVTISSSITIGALEKAPLGHIEGGDPLEATEICGGENPSPSKLGKQFNRLHEIIVRERS